MKKHASIIGIIFLTFIISVSCNQQSAEADLQEDLAGIREGHEEVINRIDEAMNNIEDVSEFRRGIQNALDELDNQIEDYHTEMDNANLRIDKETRDAIIEMKQKKTAIEFKLSLLGENNGGSTIGMTDGAERTGDATGPDREYDGSDWTDTDEVPLTDQIDERTGPQRPGQMRSPERTGEWAGGPENSDDPARNESEIQGAARETPPTVSADELEQTKVYRTPEPSDAESSGAERTGIIQDTTQSRGISASERSASERSENERTGAERSGAERSGIERSGIERSGSERSEIMQDTAQSRGISASERSENERSENERTGAERSGEERSGIMQDTAQTSVTTGAERTREMENDEEDGMSSYYLEILNEIKNDIRELRSEIEEFKQKEL